MKFIQALGALTQPRKSEFIKTLAAKRRQLGGFGAVGTAYSGTPEYTLAQLGLGAFNFALGPEATVADILSHYWSPSLQNMYGSSASDSELRGNALQRQEALAKLNKHIASIEYRRTQIPDAATRLPSFDSLRAYMRHCLDREHPITPHCEHDGFTDEYFEYAVEASKLVFNR